MVSNNPMVKAYAKSLFVNATNLDKKLFENEKQKNSKLIFIGEELLLLRSLFLVSKQLNTHFKNPTIPEREKVDIFISLLPGLTSPIKAFLRILTERNHIGLIPEISEEYNLMLSKLRNLCKVKLIIPTSLEESFGSNLLKCLKKITKGEEIILNCVYNPNLLGGFVLEYNSTSIDASTLKELGFFFNQI